MSEDPKPYTPESTPPPANKRKLLWGLGLLALALLVIWFFKPDTDTDSSNSTRKPLFNRDEPAQQQIMQRDFKEKIENMLDSGMTVGEISRQTGVRRDVIKKIKREKAD